ncbi:MAG: S9 family peptidase [Anaerolineae bacterium]|nr:S9 family peptidase [Anaerolineae bacterium]
MTSDGEATLDLAKVPTFPSLQDLLMLDEPFAVRLSPDGALLAFTVQSTDWQENAYERLCYIHDITAGTTTPLTRNGIVIQMAWIGNRTLAVLWDSPSPWDTGQVYVYENLIGEAWQVTNHDDGVDWFAPFANGILYRADSARREKAESREQQFGYYRHFEQEPSTSALYYVGLDELRAYEKRQRQPTADKEKPLPEPVVELSKLLDEPLCIRLVVPSPTQDAIYLYCRKRDDLVYHRETSSFCIKLDAQAALAEHLRRAAEESEKGKEAPSAGTKALTPQAAGDSSPAGANASSPNDHVEAAPAEADAKGKKEDTTYLGQITPLALPRRAAIIAVSPDGRALLVEHQGRDDKLYTRADLWVIDADAAVAAQDTDAFVAAMRNITAPLDRSILACQWAHSGIFFTHADGTAIRLAHLDSAALDTARQDAAPVLVDLQGLSPSARVHVSDSGRMAFIGTDEVRPEEIYFADPTPESWQIGCVTRFGTAFEGWDLGTVETIEWPSRDGTIIQGVLRKPSDFDPSRRYPLVLIIHGGPAWFSEALLLTGEDARYYPAVQFVNKGMLVLKPNYRGSIGRGQAFQELNVNNLGVGDLWDIESGIDYLVALGWVDPERVGCMGWSQGGYISAFAGLHSSAFRAVSVGAGISDWYTYYVSNDVPDFTLDYLSASPFRDRERYTRAAPISNLTNAKTPMLIQHGAEDRRVPLSNAMELYRGLKEMNVPVELFIFPGMGHPITRPRENHAVMHQNLAWFSHYLLGEELKLE